MINNHINQCLVGMCHKIHFWKHIFTPHSFNKEGWCNPNESDSSAAGSPFNTTFYNEKDSWRFVKVYVSIKRHALCLFFFRSFPFKYPSHSIYLHVCLFMFSSTPLQVGSLEVELAVASSPAEQVITKRKALQMATWLQTYTVSFLWSQTNTVCLTWPSLKALNIMAAVTDTSQRPGQTAGKDDVQIQRTNPEDCWWQKSMWTD